MTLSGALLAAQVTWCVLSATRPRRVSVRALAAMCLPAPLALGAAGVAGPSVYLLAVILAWTAGQWRRAQQERIRAEASRAVVEERARIAREVHDVVAHTLSVMVIQAGAADDAFVQRPEQVREALRAIETGARSALGELRLLLRAFHPDAGAGADGDQCEQRPSLARLQELADSLRATGISVHVHCEGVTDVLPAAADLAAYRIVQEAVTNTVRHAADADEVSGRVTAEGECASPVPQTSPGCHPPSSPQQFVDDARHRHAVRYRQPRASATTLLNPRPTPTVFPTTRARIRTPTSQLTACRPNQRHLPLHGHSSTHQEVPMPRRSPGEIRTAQPPRRSARSRQVIPGLSTATNRQIAQFEVQYRLPPGHVAHAFNAWGLALRPWPDHGPNHGLGTTLWRDMHARTLLQDVASTMTRKARRELLGAVAPLDDRFLSRTLPDPFSPLTDPWWKRRLAETGS